MRAGNGFQPVILGLLFRDEGKLFFEILCLCGIRVPLLCDGLLLLEEPVLKMVWTMRRMLSAVGTNEGIELLLNRLAKTENNAMFLASLQKSANETAG